MDEISLPVGFVPNVQFAPLYVAIENGYFQEENISIALNHNMEIDTVALVGAGKIPFGVCSGEQVLLGKNQGLDLVYIANWYQRYPVGIVSLKDRGMESMEDLRGKKIGTPLLSGASYIGFEAMLQQSNMKDSDLSLETVGYTQAELLVAGKIDAAIIYVQNEPTQLKFRGYDVNVIAASDLISMVGNGLITNRKTINNNPDLVRRMTRAFMRGLTWTKDNPEGAYEICLKHVDGLADVKDQELQKQILFGSIELFQDKDQRPLGFSSPEAWSNMKKVMVAMGQIRENVDETSVFTNEFVNE